MPPPKPVSEPTNPARREARRTIPINSAAVSTQYESSADHIVTRAKFVDGRVTAEARPEV